MLNKNITNKNKRGWIRIVESFVAILLITGVVFVVIEQDKKRGEDTSSIAYASMISVLRDIELNNNLRSEIVGIQGSNLPVEWDEFGVSAPQTEARIIEKTPNYIECMGKICATNDVCLLSQDAQSQNQGKTIYAESAMISSTIQAYNPRILKLFCWMK